MATMRSYSLIIASSTAAFARIYHPASSLSVPPLMTSYTNYFGVRRSSRVRRHNHQSQSRLFQQPDPCCCFASSTSISSTTSLSSSHDRIRYSYRPTVMLHSSTNRHRYWNMPHTPSLNSYPFSFTPPPTASTTTTRLFGCNPNSPNAKPGDIFLSDDRNDDIGIDEPPPTIPSYSKSTISSTTTTTTITTTPINLTALRQTLQVVREILGYPTYDISLTLVNDAYMEQLNTDSRGIPSPTDVLSFSLRDSFVEPGLLKDEQFGDIDEYYDLGELFIDVDYVKRRCEEDRAMHAAAAAATNKETDAQAGGERHGVIPEGEVVTETTDKDIDDNADASEYEYGYTEVEVDDEYYYEDEYDDRGIAPAMQYIYDPEIRIHMLVVHGMLHLVGYDHETDDEYELMVVREDEVLAELKRRVGEDFGLKRQYLSPPSSAKE